jgi:hypothetical protein
VQKYERDLRRWDYMETEQQREQEKIQIQRDRYLVGNANKGGAAFNIINLDYEKSNDGEFLKQLDEEKRVRNLLRSKNIDTLSNSGYSIINGQPRP